MAYAAGFAHWISPNVGTLVIGGVAENNLVSNSRSSYYGVYLVNDGGVTLSSLNDPTLNINNPNAPINQGGGPVADVSAPVGLFALLSGLFFFARRRG